jgi:hypothetical protein
MDPNPTEHTVKVFTTNIRIHTEKVEVKQSLYKSGQTLRIPGGSGSQIQDSRQMKAVRLSALRTGRLCHQEILLVLVSVSDLV